MLSTHSTSKVTTGTVHGGLHQGGAHPAYTSLVFLNAVSVWRLDSEGTQQPLLHDSGQPRQEVSGPTCSSTTTGCLNIGSLEAEQRKLSATYSAPVLCSTPDSPVLDIDVCLALFNQHLDLHSEESNLVMITLHGLLQVEGNRRCFSW